AQGDSPCRNFLTNSHPGRQPSTDLIVRYVTFLLNGYKKSQPLGEAGKLVEQNAVTQTSLQGISYNTQNIQYLEN
ncbi:hypothetical protein ACYOA9_001729, partial [Escherichia coli]